jgi:hypothetical protein
MIIKYELSLLKYRSDDTTLLAYHLYLL